MSEAPEGYYIREIAEDELLLALDFRQKLFLEMGVSENVLIPICQHHFHQ